MIGFMDDRSGRLWQPNPVIYCGILVTSLMFVGLLDGVWIC